MPVEVETVRSVEMPTKIVHGAGAIARLRDMVRELGITRPLLVTDPGVAAAGLAERALEQLDNAVVFDGVRPNPDIALVDEGAKLYTESSCDGLVAVGGGSSMDTAKAIGVVARHGGSIVDYEWGHDPIEQRIPPLVAVPTTAGTGSEVTLWAVITDHEREIKFNVGGTPLIGPHIALIDPELMLGLPSAVTAATGMDALSHAIECYTCDYHQPFSDAVALQAIELVADWLRIAVKDGSNLEARTHMAHAATLGGMAYGTESAGAAHAMSQSAGGVHDCPHGALTGRVLGPVMEYNAPADPVRHARIARGLGADISGMAPLAAAHLGVEELYRLTDDVGIPTMEELGFSEEEIPMLARIAFEDPQTIGNAREVDVAAYEKIYRNAFSPGEPMSVAMEDYRMVIGGTWAESESGARFEATSPATGENLGTLPEGTREDAQRAIAAANAARRDWAGRSAFERAAAMERVAELIEERRDDLARTLTLDQGKPLHAESYGEVEELVAYWRMAAADATRLAGSMPPSVDAAKRVLAYRVPRGVVGVITPWNWPYTMPAEVIAPALAAGNAVVWTPASSTGVCAVKLAECIVDAGLPAGVFSMITGPGAVVGDEIAASRGTHAIGFIGSVATGLKVAARAAGKATVLELGGNGPLVVLDDADIEAAAEASIAASFLCAGQSCTAGELFLVHEAVHDEFVERLRGAIERSVRLGDPLAEETTMGPLNNEPTAQKMDEHVADAVERGAQLVTGGRRAGGFPTDLYWEPTVLADVTEAMDVAREETFGPVVPITRIASDEEALQIANASEYGLLTAVWTRDLARGLRFAEAVEAGWVNINESTNYWESHLPFGGRAGKSSGVGRVGGSSVLEAFTEPKTVVLSLD